MKLRHWIVVVGIALIYGLVGHFDMEAQEVDALILKEITELSMDSTLPLSHPLRGENCPVTISQGVYGNMTRPACATFKDKR